MTEEFLMNSQFSIARFYGGMTFNGREYIIVDKHGRDLWECSIGAGEPADLILKTLKPAYRKLGRDHIINLIKDGKTEAEIKALAKPKKKEGTN
jgi:hypothetical protein